MLTLPASASDVLAQVIVPALATLPQAMDSPEARLLLLAIGAQESGYRARQQVGGPARGFWQFEINGVLAVMHNTRTAGLMFDWCRENDITYGSHSIYDQLDQDDELACVPARLMLWADPRPLPKIGDVQGAFDYYERGWMPGKPNYSRWRDTAYPQALAAIQRAAA